jgi:hypothetical protein
MFVLNEYPASLNFQHLRFDQPVARALEEALGNDFVSAAETFIRKCPECNSRMRKETGCSVCYNCGFSKCG